MQANIHIFNVHNGDSIIIQIIENEVSYWIVIDSNIIKKNGKNFCPAFEFLSQNKIEAVDTVILTHLHSDHYTGLDLILNGFKVNKVVIPPFLSQQSSVMDKQFKALSSKIRKANNITSDEQIARGLLSLAKIIEFLAGNEEKIIQATGPENVFRIDGISKPIGNILLPLPRVKGQLRQILERGEFELDSFKEMNDASVVLELNIGHHKFIFGADSTREQWGIHQKQMGRSSIHSLNGTMLKVPHHGSKDNNNKKIFDYIFGSNLGQKVFVSAGGKIHPDDELFSLISDRQLKPHCTSLAKQCMGDKVHSISGLLNIHPVFRSFISAYTIDDLPIPCQGDITISIDDESVQVYSSTGNACPYRMDETPKIRELFA